MHNDIRDSIKVLANLESLNAELIKQGLSPQMRLEKLNSIAIEQLSLLLTYSSQKNIPQKRSEK